MESFDSPSLSPAQLLARLSQLRALQEATQDELQRRRQPLRSSSSELPPALHELLSQLAGDSASYQTFRRLLHDSDDTQESPRSDEVSCSRIRSDDLIEGVSVLNISQESECVSAASSMNRSEPSRKCGSHQPQENVLENLKQKTPPPKSILKKHIELDEMPIISPRTDFETLLIEKIQMEKNNENQIAKNESLPKQVANKPYLRRGEGLSRFGLKKQDLIIQNTKSLPWKRKSLNSSQKPTGQPEPLRSNLSKQRDSHSSEMKAQETEPTKKVDVERKVPNKKISSSNVPTAKSGPPEDCHIKPNVDQPQISIPQTKANKTWAAILTQEQDLYLRQLKQSSYYKNFESPARSVTSDASCDDALQRLRHERETAEQNMFELLESKVSHASFCSESSFIHKFFSNKPDNSGDSTPLILQRCLANDPKLLKLFPAPQLKPRDNVLEHCEEQTVDESCDSECIDCDRESCSSASSCCTCRTVEETNCSVQTSTPQVKDDGNKIEKQLDKIKEKTEKEKAAFDSTVTEANDIMKANMEEMNVKLSATSELLKQRLHELENEIEMFRRENASLAKMREELDVEKQRFFDERAAYEQKFNEEKFLSEYYLAEEKEKLAKQKQVYDRYVREMRGRLNKKEKEEVTKLKTEIEELKEENRCKDAKYTTCIARLRNQLKMVEKEKKDLQDECEKQKKENRRIQQVNTTTKRLSNVKYLTEINRKLAMMASNDKLPAVRLDEDAKYRSDEISSHRRAAKRLPIVNQPLRVRAKSVPNLTVTSRYAKYFSQRDAMSQMERERVAGGDYEDAVSVISGDNDSSDIDYNVVRNFEKISIGSKSEDLRCKTMDEDDHSDSGELTNMERIYLEKFKNNPKASEKTNECEEERQSARSNKSSLNGRRSIFDQHSPTSTDFRSKSPGSNVPLSASSQSFNRSKSPIPPLNLFRSGSSHTLNRSKSPIPILSNRSSNGSRKSSMIHEHHSSSSAEISPVNLRNKNDDGYSVASVTRTNLNPTEFKRPDGDRELRYPNGNVKVISADGKTSKFIYYNGDIKETFYDEGRIKYFYAETNTYHTTHPDGLEVLQFPDGQVEKRYADGSVEIRLPNGSVRYTDPRSAHVSEEWRFPDGAVLTVARDGEQLVRFPNGQREVHAKDHKRREFPDGTVKLVYTDGTSETRYASGRVRIKDRQGTLIMDSASSR